MGFYHYNGWLVGCFGFYGPLRQYFSLYRAVSQREGERIDANKNVQTTPTRTYCKRSRSLPYCNPNRRTPRHWKFTQHHRTTRPPHIIMVCYDQGKREEAGYRNKLQAPQVMAQNILPQATAALTKLKPIWRDYNKLVLFCETLQFKDKNNRTLHL